MSKPNGVDETVLTEHALTLLCHYFTAWGFANAPRFGYRFMKYFHLWEAIVRPSLYLWLLVCFLSVLSFPQLLTWWSIFITTVNIATRWYWWDCLWQGCRSDFFPLLSTYCYQTSFERRYLYWLFRSIRWDCILCSKTRNGFCSQQSPQLTGVVRIAEP